VLVGGLAALGGVLTFVVITFVRGVPALATQLATSVNTIVGWLTTGRCSSVPSSCRACRPRSSPRSARVSRRSPPARSPPPRPSARSSLRRCWRCSPSSSPAWRPRDPAVPARRGAREPAHPRRRGRPPRRGRPDQLRPRDSGRHVLQPLQLGRAVKLHPLAVVLAIATGLAVAASPGPCSWCRCWQYRARRTRPGLPTRTHPSRRRDIKTSTWTSVEIRLVASAPQMRRP